MSVVPIDFRDCVNDFDVGVNEIIIYTKKLLNSDWLRKECSSSVTRVQTCNTSAKLVARVQITNGF